MKIRNYILLVLVSLSVLSGCANTAAKRTASGLELDLNATADEGFVVLKVVATQPISLLNPKWQGIQISSAAGNDEISDITPTYNMLMGRYVPTESLYFAKLKHGEYEITGMGSVGPGPGLLLALLASDSVSANQRLPRFSVRAGKLANLGTLVFAPEVKAVQSEQMVLLNGPTGKKAALESLLSEARLADVSLVEEGGWNHTVTAQVEEERLAQARQLVSTQTVQSLPQGQLSGTHLGVLLKRDGPEAWTQETINTLGRVNAVSYTTDGRMIVGGAYGEYFVKSPGGGWRNYRLPVDMDRVAYVEPRTDGSAIFIMANLMRTRVLLKKALEGDEPATELARMENPPEYLLSTRKELIFAWNIPGLMREVVITRIDKQTLAVSTQNEKFWIIDWQALPDDTVVLSRMNGLSLYKSVWTNDLRTWEHTESPGAVSTYWFDAQNGVSLDYSAGFVMVANQLRSTSDGGKTWTRQGKPIETMHVAGRIVYADQDEILLQSRYALFSTRDRGQTWKQIVPPQTAKPK